jgi:hypothetical protein
VVEGLLLLIIELDGRQKRKMGSSVPTVIADAHRVLEVRCGGEEKVMEARVVRI